MGTELIDTVCLATGLPKNLIQTELVRILKEGGVEPKNATLDDLRSILASYLQDILLSTKNELK